MALSVSYPHHRISLEPKPLSAIVIWAIADHVRRQIEPRRHLAKLEFAGIVPRLEVLRINGRDLPLRWEFDQQIMDDEGRDALGVTETDVTLPGNILIGINGVLIGDRDDLKQSTLAHELGHAIFDGPAMLARLDKASVPAFASVPLNDQHLVPRAGSKAIDWREFRANEFMGGLLVPRTLLQRVLIRRAIAFKLPLIARDEDAPVIRKPVDSMRWEELMIDLADHFGVSASFIETRIRRYGLSG